MKNCFPATRDVGLDEIARGEKREAAPADACASHTHEHGPASG